jgi:hypothetical protein
MDNPETLATLGTQNTGRRQIKHKKHKTTHKSKKMSNTNPRHKRDRGWTQVLAKGKHFLPLIPDFRKSKLPTHKNYNSHRKSLRKDRIRPAMLVTYSRRVWHLYSKANPWVLLQTTGDRISKWSTTLVNFKYITIRKHLPFTVYISSMNTLHIDI